VKEKRKISDSDTNEIQSEKKLKVKVLLKMFLCIVLFSFCIVMFKNVSYVYRFVFPYYLNFMLNCLL